MTVQSIDVPSCNSGVSPTANFTTLTAFRQFKYLGIVIHNPMPVGVDHLLGWCGQGSDLHPGIGRHCGPLEHLSFTDDGGLDGGG